MLLARSAPEDEADEIAVNPDIDTRRSAVGGKVDVPATWPGSPLLAISGHSGDELSPYSTGVWIEFGLWLRNLFASVIVEFRVFVGSPVEVLDFNLEFPRDPKGF